MQNLFSLAAWSLVLLLNVGLYAKGGTPSWAGTFMMSVALVALSARAWWENRE